MALYCYLKSSPKVKNKKTSFFWRLFSVGLVVIGIVFLVNAVAPIVLYEFESSQFKQQIISPVVLGEALMETDYRNPRNWFPIAPQLPPKPSKITHYSLSIPKLKIEDAVVQIGGEDLMKSLIHYSGTSLPGQSGNTVVFGHSVLPQFFNPTNYKTIFSTLSSLEKGDEVFVDFDGILYHYQVVRMVETSPEDVSILEQRYNDSLLTLITCVPPGTYLKRLVVSAELVSI